MQLPILAHTLKERAVSVHGSALNRNKTDNKPITGSSVYARPSEKRCESSLRGRSHKYVTGLSLPYRSSLPRENRAFYDILGTVPTRSQGSTRDMSQAEKPHNFSSYSSTVPTRSQGSTRDMSQAEKPHNLSSYSSTMEQTLRESVSEISTIVEYPQLSLNRISGCD